MHTKSCALLTMSRLDPLHLQLTWETSSCGGASDYGIYQGLMGSWSSYAAVDCHDDGGDRSEVLPISSDDCYYLVVPHNPEAEGSYGFGVFGERPAASTACAPTQELACF